MDTYSPDNIIGDFDGGDFLQGAAKGTFVEVEKTSDQFSMSVGSRGDVTRVESLDPTGTVTVTLKQGSAANAMLSAKAALKTIGPLLLKDLGGTTLVHAQNAWVRKPAAISFGNEDETRKWVIDCADLEVVVGGAN